MDSDKKTDKMFGPYHIKDITCKLCLDIFTRPISASCKHAFCTACIAVIFTKNLPDLNNIQCREPSCKVQTQLQDYKPDVLVNEKLEYYESCLHECKSCGHYKGLYADWVDHTADCGGGLYDTHYTNCDFFGCGQIICKPLWTFHINDWCPFGLLTNIATQDNDVRGVSYNKMWRIIFKRQRKNNVLKDHIDRLACVYEILNPKMLEFPKDFYKKKK